MDSFVNLLTELGFVRTNTPLSRPLVVHAVAGAGKSSLIRRHLESNPNAVAQTWSRPDHPNLLQRYIRPYVGATPGAFNILDEYPAQPLQGDWDVVIADPLQYGKYTIPPHYVKSITHRFGKATTSFLQEQGFLVHPADDCVEDSCTTAGIFDGPLQGHIIAVDHAAKSLVEAHGVQATCPKSDLGLQYDVVTAVSTRPLSEIPDRHNLYIALTRHKIHLHVLTPQAYTTT